MSNFDYILQFAKLYGASKCLWDGSYTQYKKEERDAAYGELIKILQQIDENATLQTVRARIHSLRATVIREVRRSARQPNHVPGPFYSIILPTLKLDQKKSSTPKKQEEKKLKKEDKQKNLEVLTDEEELPQCSTGKKNPETYTVFADEEELPQCSTKKQNPEICTVLADEQQLPQIKEKDPQKPNNLIQFQDQHLYVGRTYGDQGFDCYDAFANLTVLDAYQLSRIGRLKWRKELNKILEEGLLDQL